MKKVALSFMVLSLIGAGAFAQTAPSNVKIGGYLDTGIESSLKADSGNSTIIKGDDTGKVGGSFDLKGEYALSSKAGAKFNFRLVDLSSGLTTLVPVANATSYTIGDWDVQNAYIWFLVPQVDMVKVLAGNIDGSGWGGVDDKGANVSGGQGIQVQVAANGFTVGGQIHPSTTAAAYAPISFGAAFAQDKLVKLAGGIKTATKDTDVNAVTLGNLYVTGSLLAVDNLTLTAGYNMEDMNLDKSNGTNYLDVNASYKVMDPLSVGLLTYVYTYGGDKKSTEGDAAALSFKVKPSVSYTVNEILGVGFAFTYQSGYSIEKANKETLMEINPNATVTIDPNAKVLLNYLYDAKAGDSKPAKDATYSTIKVEFRYSF